MARFIFPPTLERLGRRPAHRMNFGLPSLRQPMEPDCWRRQATFPAIIPAGFIPLPIPASLGFQTVCPVKAGVRLPHRQMGENWWWWLFSAPVVPAIARFSPRPTREAIGYRTACMGFQLPRPQMEPNWSWPVLQRFGTRQIPEALGHKSARLLLFGGLPLQHNLLLRRQTGANWYWQLSRPPMAAAPARFTLQPIQETPGN